MYITMATYMWNTMYVYHHDNSLVEHFISFTDATKLRRNSHCKSTLVERGVGDIKREEHDGE